MVMTAKIRRSGKQHRVLVLAGVGLAIVAVACSSPGSGPASLSRAPATPHAASAVAEIVGRWQQSADVHTCENYVRAMDDEGLLAAVEPSPPFQPGEDWRRVSNDFCDPGPSDFDVIHSHFFDESGHFGSLDEHGNQVDNGTYVIVDDATIRIGQSTFAYEVSGDSLVLDPVIAKPDRREALAKPGKFTAAVWMVSVAFPGTSWQRVECDGWC